MKSKTKEEREAVKKTIASDTVKKELQWEANNCGRLWLILSLSNRFCYVVLKLPQNYVDNRNF